MFASWRKESSFKEGGVHDCVQGFGEQHARRSRRAAARNQKTGRQQLTAAGDPSVPSPGAPHATCVRGFI